jgi:hypothetical protein
MKTISDESVELLEFAITKIDSMLSDYSNTSIASCSEVNDGLLDIRLHISKAMQN